MKGLWVYHLMVNWWDDVGQQYYHAVGLPDADKGVIAELLETFYLPFMVEQIPKEALPGAVWDCRRAFFAVD